MNDPKFPSNVLTVVIRNDGPMIHCGDSPSYRSVRVILTEEQVARLSLHTVGSNHIDGETIYIYEEISRCIIEPPSVTPNTGTK